MNTFSLADIFVELLRNKMRCVFAKFEPNVSIVNTGCAQILQLFVQHHSSLLHASKHAPDCIGFKGAFETQRFPVALPTLTSSLVLISVSLRMQAAPSIARCCG
jgi:hypothetical protein